MRRGTEIFIGFFFVIGFAITLTAIHEIVHYLIATHYDSDVVEICFWGVYMGDWKTAGWTLIANETNESYRWNSYWDWDFNG